MGTYDEAEREAREAHEALAAAAARVQGLQGMEAGVGGKVAAAEQWCRVCCNYGIELRLFSLL